MKKTIFFVLLLFMLVGAVSAADDNNITDSLELEETSQDIINSDDTPSDTLKEADGPSDATLKSNSTSESITPTLITGKVKGTPGEEITLKATVEHDGKAISNATVVFKFNEKIYTTVTDDNGVASIKIGCPASKAVDTAYKLTGKQLTKKTKYSKTYSGTATVSGEGINTTAGKFNVISKKSVVKKYKVIKKTKIVTIKIKKKHNLYKKGTNRIAVLYLQYTNAKRIVITASEKYHKFVKFSEQEHIKDVDNKWKWSKWFKVKKGKRATVTFVKNVKIDKIRVKYTQITYKKIK